MFTEILVLKLKLSGDVTSAALRDSELRFSVNWSATAGSISGPGQSCFLIETGLMYSLPLFSRRPQTGWLKMIKIDVFVDVLFGYISYMDVHNFPT